MKLFLDANVIYSAAKSELGASYGIFHLKDKLKIKLVSSRLALVETERNISEKEDSRVVERFYWLIKAVTIISVESSKAKRFYGQTIEEKDAPILFGAKQIKADFLITLDKRHFFTEKMRKAKFPFKIMTPGQFIMSLK